MPRKNKRKFFFGKSKKSKSAKLDNQNVTTELENQQQSDSEEEEDNNATEKGEREKARSGNLQKSAVHASISSVTNYSASELGGQNCDANSQLSLAEVHAYKMGTTSSSRWRSEPILNVLEKENRKATITLKIIQFIPKAEVASDDDKIKNEDIQKFIDNTRCVYEDADHNKSKTIKDDTVISKEIAEQNQPSSVLHVDKDFAIGEVPKLDHPKEQKRRRHFDDNYRVESPKQIQTFLQTEENRNKRRHAMLIQEISESSSSEEVKQFLDAEASALEMKSEAMAVPTKVYRVDSPESSSNDDEVNRCKQSSLVQEICESSSNESVKNEMLVSQSKLTSLQAHEPGKIVTLKIINIKELPSDDLQPTSSKKPASPIMKHNNANKQIEKKLNKAEEAIMEALYGNPNLLQIPNTPLDVISEEGSDCSDIERHSKINQPDIDDDEVFLPSSITSKSAELSSPSKFKHRRRVLTVNSTPPVEQPTMLINTKIIETESNVPESCKTWETKAGDSELQAELVYLPSTSSSATDLSERSGDITDPEDTTADTSEDTETNSMLENISVPSLFAPSLQQNSNNILQDACEFYIDSEQNQFPLPDILEECDELSQKSLELIENQQQIIEDVNKELHHLVSCDEFGQLKEKKNETKEESLNEEVEVNTSVTEVMYEEGLRKEENKTKINTQQQKSDPNVIVSDKKLTTTTDNESQTRQTSSNSGTPTQFRRKYSSDSSSSSANSQCTIIRQTVPIDNSCVHPLKDLCMQSLQSGFDNNNNNDDNINNDSDAKITVQKKFNSISRNAPNIPIINELELHYNDDDRPSRENQRDKVITILQVPPDINSSSEMNEAVEKTRWYGLPSTQMPNLMIALSPLQKDYISSAPVSQQTTANVDVLLDMHKKFVERRAYHEKSDDENSDSSRLAKVLKQENEYHSNVNNQSGDSIVENVCDVEMKTARESPQKSSNNGFEVKRDELENELKLLDIERQELEEELKNLQSLQHFKQEEYIYAQKKLENDLHLVSGTKVEEESQLQSMESKYANDDFTEFINSNEKMHQEIYNEWQDKVYQRNERKLQKTLKITSVNDAVISSSSLYDTHLERAASEKYVPLRDEFISKVKERQKRLSLPIDDSHNWDGSTESLLDDEKAGIRKKKKKVYHVENKENNNNFPAHFREFLEYCEQEIAQSKNSVESGKSVNTLSLLGLIGVASLCICGFFIWKNSSKFTP